MNHDFLNVIVKQSTSILELELPSLEFSELPRNGRTEWNKKDFNYLYMRFRNRFFFVSIYAFTHKML